MSAACEVSVVNVIKDSRINFLIILFYIIVSLYCFLYLVISIAEHKNINCQQQYVPHIRRLRIIKTEITYSSIIKASELAGEVELDMLKVLLCH